MDTGIEMKNYKPDKSRSTDYIEYLKNQIDHHNEVLIHFDETSKNPMSLGGATPQEIKLVCMGAIPELICLVLEYLDRLSQQTELGEHYSSLKTKMESRQCNGQLCKDVYSRVVDEIIRKGKNRIGRPMRVRTRESEHLEYGIVVSTGGRKTNKSRRKTNKTRRKTNKSRRKPNKSLRKPNKI